MPLSFAANGNTCDLQHCKNHVHLFNFLAPTFNPVTLLPFFLIFVSLSRLQRLNNSNNNNDDDDDDDDDDDNNHHQQMVVK